MNWQIEEMQPAYRSDLQTLYLQSRIQVFTWLDTSEYSLSDFDSATLGETILVAVITQRPVGFISWWAPNNFIHNVYVDPRFLKRGIGKALLDRCLEGIGRPATLKCLQKNTNALSFYQTQGWTIKDECSSDDGPYYLMEYNL
ncbi:MAG: GNAT family N-acetyltransferase [Cytophagaceae bacterium]|nr:MAG: GNAT family N-acetyltransferase [Cytophagaceae bacterium]